MSLKNKTKTKHNLDESKVFQYFGNVRHNSTLMKALAKVVNERNYTGLENAILA